MTNSASDYLFTYGTLMQGFDNPSAKRLRNSAGFLGRGFFPGLLYNISWYPGAVYDKSLTRSVYGEIYKLNEADEILSDLDEYEDVFEDESASLYVRQIVPVTLSDQSILHCWAYLYNQSVDELELIQSGDFYKI